MYESGLISSEAVGSVRIGVCRLGSHWHVVRGKRGINGFLPYLRGLPEVSTAAFAVACFRS